MTAAERRVLQFIDCEIRMHHGYPSTQRIMQCLREPGIRDAVHGLVIAGLIRRLPKVRRGANRYELTAAGVNLLQGVSAA